MPVAAAPSKVLRNTYCMMHGGCRELQDGGKDTDANVPLLQAVKKNRRAVVVEARSLRRTLYKLDTSLIGIDGTGHLVAIHGQFAFVEGRRSSGLRRRLNGELVSFDNSGDGYRILFAGPHPPRHHVTGLPERCLTGYRAV